MTESIAACWSPREIQAATQIDVGSWEFADPVTDAVFTAVHQSVPIARLSRVPGADPVEVTEDEVVEDFRQPLTSNEPHLRFITGQAGTGKSHLVRLLRARVAAAPEWHVVYVEKASTDLRLIIEKILAGIHTPIVERLRQDLNAAATNLTDPHEAGLALINKLHQFLAYDTATEIEGANAREVAAARPIAERLIGDYAFKIELLREGGPVERITALAFKGVNDGADVKPEDLVFAEQDLRVEPEAFLDAVPDLRMAVKRLVTNAHVRTTIAALLNHYLPRAKAEVFTGGTTDLVEVFRDVRRVLARQGKELCLYIEDLVLLHVIDTPLAQALTIPASKDLCRIRAAIAVTSGHLEKYTTFADRGVHYTMDLGRSAVSDADLRDLVGRYLNVGRVGTNELVGVIGTPNKCPDCPVQARCHDAFGASTLGHGYFPFNANSLDRLINLASRGRFDPRNILREVIRAPLDVAYDELETPGQFPSEKLADAFADARISVPFEMRNTLTRLAAAPAQEITLRALYADQPPAADDGLHKIAAVFGVQLTDVGEVPTTTTPAPPTDVARERDASPIDGWLEEWITKGTRLHTTPARLIRSWLLDAVYTQLQDGPFGLPVRRVKSGPVYDLYLGPIRVPWTAALVIKNSASSGSATLNYDGPKINFEPIDGDGVIFKGILEAEANTDSLVGPEGGRWLLQLQKRLRQFITDLVAYANGKTAQDPLPALQILGVLASASGAAGDAPSAALEAMVRGRTVTELGPAVRGFLQNTDVHRNAALAYLRDRHTARKGDGGAWSLLDAGAIIHHLKPSAALRELPEAAEQAHHELGTSVQRLRDMQASACREAWRSVNEQLGALRAYIEDDADFRDSAKAMDEFATRAHNASILLNSDALDRYRALRSAATDKAFTTHQRLARIAAPAPAAALLWELAKDPLPELAALREYWAYCHRLLEDARLDLPQGNQDDGTFGRARMQSAFRELADALEEETGD